MSTGYRPPGSPAPRPPTPFPPRDARSVITPDAFQVAPELLGLPLARPWRRGAAMTVDALLVTLLANAPSVLFGLAGALVLFRVSARPTAAGSYLGHTARLSLRLGAAVLLFAALVGSWNSTREGIGRRIGGAARSSDGGGQESRSGAVTGVQGIRIGAEILAVRAASDPAQAEARLDRAISSMRAQGMQEGEIREMLVDIAGSVEDRPWMSEAVDAALARADVTAEAPEAPAESLAVAYAGALSAEDSSTAGALRPRLALALAADTLRQLGREVVSLRRERGELQSRVELLEEDAKREPGVLDRLARLEDELGWGLWSGLYFTATLAMWKGRTPGKRLLGIRVLRLNGKPIGWWAAFERFGGYAAGIATGLFGFFQIFWDRNRQATHDKISETVVVRG